jgi:hypothetical protein
MSQVMPRAERRPPYTSPRMLLLHSGCVLGFVPRPPPDRKYSLEPDQKHPFGDDDCLLLDGVVSLSDRLFAALLHSVHDSTTVVPAGQLVVVLTSYCAPSVKWKNFSVDVMCGPPSESIIDDVESSDPVRLRPTCAMSPHEQPRSSDVCMYTLFAKS